MNERLIHHGHIFDLVELDTGSWKYDIINHPGSVFVIAFTKPDTIIMNKQYRPGIDKWVWELPAGLRDKEGELPAETAARELEEETGYRAHRFMQLGQWYPSYGMSRETVTVFVATDVEKKIETHEIPFGKAIEMVYNGEIDSAIVCLALLHVAYRFPGGLSAEHRPIQQSSVFEQDPPG